MPKLQKMGPRCVRRRGQTFERITIKFRRRHLADEDRARAQDAFVRTHGFKIIRGLTANLARGLGRFRTYVAKAALPALRRRLKRLVAEGAVHLWVAGVRITD